ncbi:MAG: transcriptional regulator [Deltaproteobacteria bacterium]|nr:transcriptional regulator [Deltaproteobacteria bacterium]
MDPKNLEFLKNIAKGIVSVFGDRCEVVIHDFSDLKKSLVYIEGDITKRHAGCPIPDTLYRLLKEFGDDAPDKFGYKGTTKDGKILKCSTTMVRGDDGKLEGCLCINFNVTDFAFLATAFNDFTFSASKSSRDNDKETNQNGITSTFAETMESAVDFEISEYGKVPGMMDKSDKLVIMERLDKDGVFMIKGSVDYMARVFGASRYTIYNYLKQIRT